MKIAIVSLDNSEKILSGGKHIHQQLLKIALEKSQHRVTNFFPRRTLIYFLWRILFVFLNKLNIMTKADAFIWTLNYFKNDLMKQMRFKDFDIILSQDPVSALAAKQSNLKTKIVMTLHGYLSLESINYGYFPENEKQQVIDCARKYEIDSLKCADHVITVDAKISNYLRNEFNYQKKIVVLKNAINPDLFNQLSQREKNRLKQQLEISSDQVIVLVPRRLVKKNGVEISIKAIAHLKGQNLVLVVMGEGPEYKNLQTLQKELGLTYRQVKFIGSKDHSEAVKFYDLADIVLVPSVISDGVEEATSLSMLEGMAARKIVIVSAIGGMKDVIVSGYNGYTFEQGNDIQLAKLLTDVLAIPNSERQSIVNRAFSDVCQNHHYLNHAQTYLENTQESNV